MQAVSANGTGTQPLESIALGSLLTARSEVTTFLGAWECFRFRLFFGTLNSGSFISSVPLRQIRMVDELLERCETALAAWREGCDPRSQGICKL